MDRTLKMLLNERSGNFLRQTFVTGFCIKINKHKMNLNIFFSKKQQFPQSPECIKKYSSKYMAAYQ